METIVSSCWNIYIWFNGIFQVKHDVSLPFHSQKILLSEGYSKNNIVLMAYHWTSCTVTSVRNSVVQDYAGRFKIDDIKEDFTPIALC